MGDLAIGPGAVRSEGGARVPPNYQPQTVPLADVDTLIRTKRSKRHRDLADIEDLERLGELGRDATRE